VPPVDQDEDDTTLNLNSALGKRLEELESLYAASKSGEGREAGREEGGGERERERTIYVAYFI